MDYNTALFISICVVALLLIAFFGVFRGKGKFSFKSKLVEVNAEGENPLPTIVPQGIRIKEAEAGGRVHADNTGGGGIELEKVKAKGDIEATNTFGGASPPKK